MDIKRDKKISQIPVWIMTKLASSYAVIPDIAINYG